jgi:hypothetical protein
MCLYADHRHNNVTLPASGDDDDDDDDVETI